MGRRQGGKGKNREVESGSGVGRPSLGGSGSESVTGSYPPGPIHCTFLHQGFCWCRADKPHVSCWDFPWDKITSPLCHRETSSSLIVSTEYSGSHCDTVTL